MGEAILVYFALPADNTDSKITAGWNPRMALLHLSGLFNVMRGRSMGYVRHPLAGKKLTVTPCICDVTFHIYSPADYQMKWLRVAFILLHISFTMSCFLNSNPGFHVTQTSPFSMPDPWRKFDRAWDFVGRSLEHAPWIYRCIAGLRRIFPLTMVKWNCRRIMTTSFVNDFMTWNRKIANHMRHFSSTLKIAQRIRKRTKCGETGEIWQSWLALYKSS